MKKSIRALLFVLVAILALAPIGCRPSEEDGIDKTKTQLYVSVYNGGYGNEWMIRLAERFEDFYKDTSFEPGKTGVQIIRDDNKSSGTGRKNDILTSRNEVFFSPEAYYYEYINAGVLADVTDVVTSDLSEFGDTGTIEDKMNENLKSYYKTSDGKYYGIHNEVMVAGFSYDVQLFEDEMYYFSANKNNGNKGFIITKNETRSNGPDGVQGTDDDGLPATYEEFFKLCDYIVDGGNIPMVWSGQYHMGYMGWLLQALMTDYEGAEQVALNYSFNGTAKNIVDYIDQNGNVVKKDPVTITNANGNEMFKTAGRYYALKFMEQMVSTPKYYSAKAFNTTHSHLDAQLDFIMSTKENSKIAMFMDGCYWEMEAKDMFNSMVNKYQDESYSRYNRKFGFMPYPKATENDLGKTTLVDGLHALGYVRGNLTGVKLDLAKKFLKFANTNASLVDFSITTNTPRALNYTMTDAEKAQMSNYGRSLINLKERSDLTLPVSTNPLYLANQSKFNNKYTFVASIDGTTYNDPLSILRPSQANSVTAEQFFNGISAMWSDWASNYGQYI